MQTSGTAPQFSDGMRKTITGVASGRRPAPAALKAAAPPKVPAMPKPASSAATHRRGGYAKHGGQ